MSDVTDEHVALVPPSGGKTVGWIIGHLCITGDFIRRKAGAVQWTSKKWGQRFAPGSGLPAAAADYPPIRDMVEKFDAVYRDLARIAPSSSDDLLAFPNPFTPALHRFATYGEFTAWVMTGHLGYHLGQLSGWRSAMGLALRPGAPFAI